METQDVISPQKFFFALTTGELLVVLKFLLLSAFLQYSPLVIQYLIPSPVQFSQVSPLRWRADISNLSAGRYYISAGRPQAVCDLRIGDQIISSTASGISEIKSQLVLGAGFEITTDQRNHPTTAEVGCRDQAGFYPRLHHAPFISSFYVGAVLQALRIFADVLMGPIFSLLLIVSIFLTPTTLRSNLKVSKPFLLFGIASLLYSLSLAQVGGLFFGGLAFSIVHIFLRNLFSGAFIYLCSNFSRPRNGLLLLHLLAPFGAVWVAVFYPDKINQYYYAQYILFPLSSLIIAADLLVSKQSTAVGKALIPLALAWGILQTLDFLNLAFLSAPFFAPAFIVLMMVALAVIRHNELSRLGLEAERNAMALEKASEISLLSAQVAHDLRSPLALLKVVATDTSIPDEVRKMLSAASDRLRGVVTSILESARDLRMQKSPVSEPIKLCDLRHLMLQMENERKAFTSGAQIIFKSSKEQCLASVQSTEFLRVLSNLIENAMEAEAGIVQVTLFEKDGQIELSVKDDGIGIPPDVLPNLFKEGMSFGKENGNGLGLFHAKRRVESWGGVIRISSNLEAGTEVFISLPRVDRDTSES